MTSREATPDIGLGSLPQLMPAERLMMMLIFGFALATVALAFALQRQVNWPPFLTGFFAAIFLAAIGVYTRRVKETPRIALALIGVAVFASFTAVSTVFILVLFPLPNPLIDLDLINLDASLGYRWTDFVNALANFPLFARGLGYLYHSSIPQIVIVIVLLSFLARQTILHRFLLVGILTLILTVAIWWLWPSVGPSAFEAIPEDVRLATGLYFDPGYGAHLVKLVQIGPPRVSPEFVTGVVAFPSYHTVMACMVIWYTWRTLVFIPALVANGLMFPALLSHGGHHLVDVGGGIAVFGVSVVLANAIIRPDSSEPLRA